MREQKKSISIFSISISVFSIIVIFNIANIFELQLNNDFKLEITKSMIFTSIFSMSTYINIFKIETPISLIGIILSIVLVYKINFGSIKSNSYEESYEYGSHGTARFKDDFEKKELTKDDFGWFLGSIKENETFELDKKIKSKDKSYVYKPVNNDLNMQITVIGPPGSQKTTGFVYPNIFHICNMYKNLEEKADFIITDPKSELYEKTAEYLKDNGYDVKVLDFINLKNGNCINPIHFIDDDKTLMEIAEGFVNAVQGSKGGDDEGFWSEQEGQLLGALIGFVKQKRKKEYQNFYEISEILTGENVADYEKAKEFFKRNDVKGAPLKLWKNYLAIAGASETKSGVDGGLAVKLKHFSTEGVRRITSKTDIQIDKLGMKKDKPMAIFIFMPDGDRTYAPIINVIVSIIFKQLYKNAYKTSNRLENPVYFILEEMANIGKISNIQEMLGTMRGRRIYPMMIWQSLSQMKNRYKDGFEDILSMCDTHVYLGINDNFTAEYCSKSLGDTTIKVSSTSNRKDKYNMSDGESETYQARPLLFPTECMEFDNRKMIIRQRANSPMIINKVQYKYWENKICEDSKITDLNELEEVPKYTEIENEYININ